jgi:hypothetical protein
MVLLLHCCEDNTEEIVEQVAEEFPGRTTLLRDDNPDWNEMHQRQLLLETARQRKATHIVVMDVDEAVTANVSRMDDGAYIRSLVQGTPPHQCLSLPGVQTWNALNQYRTDGLFGVRFSLAFPDRADYTWAPGRYGYQHHSRLPNPLKKGYLPHVDGGVMHYQFAHLPSLRAKQAHYKMVELLRWPEFGAERINHKYSWWNTPAQTLRPIPEDWYHSEWYRYLNKLLETHGAGRFAGLDLFGVV